MSLSCCSAVMLTTASASAIASSDSLPSDSSPHSLLLPSPPEASPIRDERGVRGCRSRSPSPPKGTSSTARTASCSAAVACNRSCLLLARITARSAARAGCARLFCSACVDETGKPTAAASDEVGSHLRSALILSASCCVGRSGWRRGAAGREAPVDAAFDVAVTCHEGGTSGTTPSVNADGKEPSGSSRWSMLSPRRKTLL